MRRSKRELRDRWLARLGAAERVALTADQAFRDDLPELNPKKRGGAPPGNRNRFVHGRYTREREAFLAEVRVHLARGRQLVAVLREGRFNRLSATKELRT
jgi:hypothetical protein